MFGVGSAQAKIIPCQAPMGEGVTTIESIAEETCLREEASRVERGRNSSFPSAEHSFRRIGGRVKR